MTIRWLTAIALCLGVAAAQLGIEAPAAGYWRDNAGDLRPILGVAGSLLPGEPLATETLSAAFWSKGGQAKTPSEVLLFNEAGQLEHRAEAPPGPAVFGPASDGGPGIAWFPDSRELRAFRAGRWEPVPVLFEGEVVSAFASKYSTLVVRRDGALWKLHVSPRTGRVWGEAPLNGAQEPLLLLPSGALLFCEPGGVVSRDSGGVERRLAVPGAVTRLEMAGRQRVHLAVEGDSPGYFLHLRGDNLILHRIPGGRR